jgi:hypothetical protein
MNTETLKQESKGFERLGECLYRKGGAIYARVRVNSRLTWRSTETSEPREARQWLKKWRHDGWLMENGIEPMVANQQPGHQDGNRPGHVQCLDQSIAARNQCQGLKNLDLVIVHAFQ